MSKLRPTLDIGKKGDACLGYESAYFRILDSVNQRRGLIHGRLEDGKGGFCAIGSYFAESSIAIPTRVVDEIAAYNDSFPHLSQYDRWKKVVAWLKFRTKSMAEKRSA